MRRGSEAAFSDWLTKTMISPVAGAISAASIDKKQRRHPVKDRLHLIRFRGGVRGGEVAATEGRAAPQEKNK